MIVTFGADAAEEVLVGRYFQSGPGRGPQEQSHPMGVQNSRISAQPQQCTGKELRELAEDGPGGRE